MSSTSIRCAALAALVATACVKPEERFDEFHERVTDAGPSSGSCTSRLADLTGEFLLAISVSVSPDRHLQFRCALAQSGDNVLDLACTPLTVEGRTDVGDALGEEGIEVAADGTFVAAIAGTVPGAANPISGSDIMTSAEGLELSGSTCAEDFFCGELAGTIEQPPVGPVTGSFGAQRIEAGATGDDLPAPVVACPET